LISPEHIRKKIPLTSISQKKIAQWRDDLIQILQGTDQRRVLIVGPCSIHNVTSAHTYAKKLKELSDEVSDVFMIIQRAYFEKARTQDGWKGLLYDPYVDNSCDIAHGIALSRAYLASLTDIGLPAATEFVDPLAAHYLHDFITWGSIGARTVQSQIHRQLASSLNMPIGFKNRPDGSVESAIQAIASAKKPHSFLSVDDNGHICKVEGRGNIYPHIVLRGGETKPNYDLASITYTLKQLEEAELPQILLVDCSHDNSQKIYTEQTHVFSFLIEQIVKGNQAIRGIMLESFLLPANQAAYEQIDPYTSITDPCLNWSSTEALIRASAQRLRGVFSLTSTLEHV
jgi:3-deoxy-7-phosphoheptulonate synthase